MSEKIINKFFEVYKPYSHNGSSGCLSLIKGVEIANKIIEMYNIKTFLETSSLNIDNRITFYDFGSEKKLTIELYSGENKFYKFIEISGSNLRIENVKKDIELKTGFILQEAKNAK